MMPLRGVRSCGSTVTVDRLTLDARSNWLSAQGTGTAASFTGTWSVSYDATVTLAGPRDTTGPSLGENIDGVKIRWALWP